MEPKDGNGVPNPNGGAGGNGDGANPPRNDNPPQGWEKEKSKLIDEIHENKKRAKELESQLESIKSKGLEEQGEFKSLYEQTKAKLEEQVSKNKKLSEGMIMSRKYDEVLREFMKAGIRDEAIPDVEFLTLDGVNVEMTDKGRMIVHGAAEYVQKKKAERPHWFKTQGAPPVNTGGGILPLETTRRKC